MGMRPSYKLFVGILCDSFCDIVEPYKTKFEEDYCFELNGLAFEKIMFYSSGDNVGIGVSIYGGGWNDTPSVVNLHELALTFDSMREVVRKSLCEIFGREFNLEEINTYDLVDYH